MTKQFNKIKIFSISNIAFFFLAGGLKTYLAFENMKMFTKINCKCMCYDMNYPTSQSFFSLVSDVSSTFDDIEIYYCFCLYYKL